MYRPRAYAIDDPEVLYEIIRARRFATIAAVIDGSVAFAYAPVILDAGDGTGTHLRYHLARANPLADLDGAPVRISFLGPDAYVSPDWYETKGMVPTWNYIAVEGSGRAHRLDESALRRLLVDLSEAEERLLAPKPAWTLDKVPEERVAMLLAAIRGFAVKVETLEGKLKLSQDKSDADLAGAITGLEGRGDPASKAVANAMRRQARTKLRHN